MKEKPIIFNAAMVRAILDGRKMQTRRILNDKFMIKMRIAARVGEISYFMDNGVLHKNDESYLAQFCPYGQVGDRLWVRENWWDKGYWKTDENFKKHWVRYRPEEKIDFYYAADGDPDGIRGSYTPMGSCIYLRKHPSIHMKRGCSRITLEITNIRVERVNSITEDDAILEGTTGGGTHPDFWVGAFRDLWDSIYKKRGYGWDKNPFVWVVEFERITK